MELRLTSCSPIVLVFLAPRLFYPSLLLVSLPLLSPRASLGISVLAGNKLPGFCTTTLFTAASPLLLENRGPAAFLDSAELPSIPPLHLQEPQPPATTVNPPNMNAKPPRCGLCTCLDRLNFSSTLYMTNQRLKKNTDIFGRFFPQVVLDNLMFCHDATQAGEVNSIQYLHFSYRRTCHNIHPTRRVNMPFPSHAPGINSHTVLPDLTSTPQHILTAVTS